VVGELRARYRSVFNLYFDDQALGNAVIEEEAELREAPPLDELAESLRARAKARADWLVATSPLRKFRCCSPRTRPVAGCTGRTRSSPRSSSSSGDVVEHVDPSLEIATHPLPPCIFIRHCAVCRRPDDRPITPGPSCR
jgi:hypothetical protein